VRFAYPIANGTNCGGIVPELQPKSGPAQSLKWENYQTMINTALRQYLDKKEKPMNEETLRRVIREELRAAH
jgi:hypothetical protein